MGRLLVALVALVALIAALSVEVVFALVGVFVLAVVIVRWPLVGLGLTIITNVLSPLVGALDISGVGLTIPRVTGALTVIGAIVWLVRNRAAPAFEPQMKPLAVFGGAVLVSVMLMPDRQQSVLGAYMLVVSVVLYLLIANLAVDRRSLLVLCGVVTLMGTLSAGIAVVQYVFPGFEVMDPYAGKLDFGEGAIVDQFSVETGPIKRVTGGTGEPVSLAYLLAVVLPLNVFWWKQPRQPWVRWAVVPIAGLQLVAMMLTYSRSGWLAAGVALAYLTWKRRLPRGPVLCTIGGLAITALIWLPPGLTERLFSMSYLRAGSTPIRLELWRTGWEMATDKWLLGYGYGQFGPQFLERSDSVWSHAMAQVADPTDQEVKNIGAHNLLLEVQVAFGLIGLIPFVAFLYRLLKDLQPVHRAGEEWARDLAACLAASILAFYLCGLLGHGVTTKVFWLVAGLSVALRRMALAVP